MVTKLIQRDINKLWERTVKRPFGGEMFVCLEQPKQGDPSLPKPYQFVLPIKKCAALVDGLKAYLKGIERQEYRVLQCASVEQKSVAHGIRLSVFMLGYEVGYCGGNDGCRIDQWQEFNGAVWEMIQQALGPEYQILPYVEDWAPGKKFQARFETYIQYSEWL